MENLFGTLRALGENGGWWGFVEFKGIEKVLIHFPLLGYISF